jgi:hypothetical protein
VHSEKEVGAQPDAGEGSGDRRNDDLTGKDLIGMLPADESEENPGSSGFDADDLKEGAYFIVRRRVGWDNVVQRIIGPRFSPETPESAVASNFGLGVNQRLGYAHVLPSNPLFVTRLNLVLATAIEANGPLSTSGLDQLEMLANSEEKKVLAALRLTLSAQPGSQIPRSNFGPQKLAKTRRKAVASFSPWRRPVRVVRRSPVNSHPMLT